MAITSTGAVSFSDLRTEFVGGNAAISLGDLYRGGSNILKKAGDNTATNDAASVPTSGAIDMEDFYSTSKGFTKTYSSGATNQNASTVFGDDYDVNYPKNIIINAGVELGATSVSEEALEVPSGAAGTITITNNGTLSGYGGAGGTSAAGSAGGDAFEAAAACTVINNGTMRSGGGGGGKGGAGGGGSVESITWYGYGGNTHWSRLKPAYGNTSSFYFHGPPYVVATGLGQNATSYGIYRRYPNYIFNNPVSNRYYVGVASNSSTSGGAGGNGGLGQGYNQSAVSGSSGAAGGTSAGTGGTGGTGGSFGNAGSTGSTGANGNASNGSSGGSGGAAGAYIRGLSNVTLTNNGTVQGNTVS